MPAWRRYYLDFLGLALSGLIYWLTIRTGFSAVLSPDSNPTLSLSVYMFFGPALLWIGATLLLVRLRGRVHERPGAPARARRPDSLGLLVSSLGRRAAAVNRGLVVIGLLLAFAVSLSVFTATYDQQAKVDAQLTLGADVTVELASWSGRVEQPGCEGGVGARGGCDHRCRTTPTPTSGRTCRTPTASIRRPSAARRPCGTPTSSAAARTR